MSFDYGFDDSLPDASGPGLAGQPGSEADDTPQPNAIEHDRWSDGIAARYMYSNRYAKSRAERYFRRQGDIQGSAATSAESLLADAFSLFFSSSPLLNEQCSDKHKLEYFRSLLDTGDIIAQRQSTKYKTSRSLAAASAITEAYLDYVEDKNPQNPSGGGTQEKHWSEQADESGDSGASLEMDDVADKAAEAVDQQLDEIDDVANQFFPGDGHQECGYDSIDSDSLYKTFSRIRSEPQLHDIAKYAGKYIQLAKSTRKSKSPYGAEDRNGIKLGKNPLHLTISEKGRASNSRMRLDLMRRMAENQAIVRNVHGYDSMGKGPIVVVLDESGSMTGRPIIHAKAIAMTFAWIARKQRRWCCMVSYEGGGRTKTLSLGTGAWNQSDMCDYLEEFLCGGGYVDLPIRELPDQIYPTLGAPKGKTDVIMISDGEYNLDNIDSSHIDRFNSWRKSEQATVTSICIRSRRADVLKSVSDTVHIIPELSESSKEIGSALASV